MRQVSTIGMAQGMASVLMVLFMNHQRRWSNYFILLNVDRSWISKNQAKIEIELVHEYKNKVRVYKKEEHELLPGQFFSDEPGVYIEVLDSPLFIFCQHLDYVVF